MACADPIENHYRLVTYVAKKFRNLALAKGEPFEDIVQSGYVGLIKAHRNFEPEFNLRFSTYAVPMICGSIRKHLRDDSGGKVYIPRPIRDYVDRIHKLGLHDKSAEEIAKMFGIPRKWAERTLAALNIQTFSLDVAVYTNENDKTVSLLEYQECESDYSSAIVEDFLVTLPQKEQHLLRMHMNGKRQREIGNVLGTSQVNVSRTLTRIGHKLKAYLG